MKRIGMKWSATLVCSACVLLLTASVGNAGLIPWVWNGIFGSHCPKNRCAPACSPSYAPSPCGPGGCGVQSTYYAPSGCSSCGTSVCGVSSCDSGGCGPAGCPTGGCSISTPATTERTPEPDAGVPQTFEGGSAKPDDEITPTKSPDEAEPPKPGDESESVEAYKPEQPIPGKDPAPTPELNEGDANPGAPTDEPSDAGGAADDDSEKEGVNAGPNLFNELHKVTWRPSVKNQRLTRRPTYAKARVIRRPRQAKGEWLVVPSTENIAKR
jgi:hypothetical protein